MTARPTRDATDADVSEIAVMDADAVFGGFKLC